MTTDAALVDRLLRLPALAAADPGLAARGLHLTAAMLVEVGATAVYVELVGGTVAAIAAGPRLMRSWQFAVRGTARAWEAYWQPIPPPGWHDLFALGKRGELRFEGDLQPLVANLQFIKDLLALPRQASP